MYTHGDYLYQVAYGYLIADALPFGNLESPEDVASYEVAQSRLSTARNLFEQSLRIDPAHGYGWVYYAQALAALSDTEAARQTLATSKELAPNTPSLSLQRINFLRGVQELSSLFDNVPALTAQEREIYSADIIVLETLKPGFLTGIQRLQ